MIGWNWTGQQKGERKVIMPTNAVGQETVSANFCLGLPHSQILYQCFGHSCSGGKLFLQFYDKI